MDHPDLPALFRSADAASNSAQSALLLNYKWNTALLLAGSCAALADVGNSLVAMAGAVLFLASFGVFISGRRQQWHARWYRNRALAESVKTASWRLVMAAEPFAAETEQKNLDGFRGLLGELLSENRDMGQSLSREWANEDQITARMLETIRLPFADKRAIYLKERIDQQRNWYETKARTCGDEAEFYTKLLYGAYGVAIVLLLVRIGYPDVKHLPINILAVLASAVVGWMQLKRYDELASAYGLTAHEVGIVRSRFSEVQDAASLAAFVSDAENAFSREHTQWAARRDH